MTHIQDDVSSLTLDPIWQTNEGHNVPISKMEEEHVVNCIDYLERQKQRRLDDGMSESEVEYFDHNIEVFRRRLVGAEA